MVSVSAADAKTSGTVGLGHNDDYHHDDTASRRDQLPGRTGRKVKGLNEAALRERHVHLNPRYVGLVHDRGFRHVALQLAALRREQVAARGVLTHNFAGPGDLEPL